MASRLGKTLFTYYVEELMQFGKLAWRMDSLGLEIIVMNEYHPKTGSFKVSITFLPRLFPLQ